MAVGERQTQKQQRRKTPSFSSSLLDAIYHSIDEQQQVEDSLLQRKNKATLIEQEIESLRRAIMVEKWMQNYNHIPKPRHHSSNSSSSTDSSIFSSSETESSASRPSARKPKDRPATKPNLEATPKCEGRFTRTKSKALKIYGDLKKVKEPISPGGKIANFLNTIFSPRNLKKNQGLEEWASVRKSRSMKDTTASSLASRSCLSKNPSSRTNKAKRSVRFCPAVSIIVDEDIHHNASMSNVGSQFIKKNIDSFRLYEENNLRKHGFREFYESEGDVDDKSCASSDLFELENIGRIGIGVYEQELPVYGTTSLNQAIASGFIM